MRGETLKKSLFLILSLTLFLVGGFFLAKVFFIDRRIPKVAGLRVVAIPKANVFLNNEPVGEAPFNKEDLLPGEYSLRIEPVDKSANLITWQSKISLVAGSLTYISRSLAPTSEQSSGQMIWLEPIPDSTGGEIAVVSVPNKARIYLDGVEKGESSLILKNISAADHEVRISAIGYSDQIVSGKVVAGHRLNIVVNLSKATVSVEKSAANKSTDTEILGQSTTSAEIQKPYVIVKETPTGFLRVRAAPTLVSSESGKIYPGEKYPLISEVPGWTEISLKGLLSGWANDQYLEKVK